MSSNASRPCVIRADESHVVAIGRLFDLYRQFYQCDADLELACRFIGERIKNNESVIFIATENETVVGFTQIYPSFCSVDAIKIFILHDLYVDQSARNKGVGKLLMDKAREHVKQQGAGRIDLLTEHTNKPGQHLYEKLGYRKVLENYYAYSLAL